MVEHDGSVDRSETEPEKAREDQRRSRPKQVRMQTEGRDRERERKRSVSQQGRPPQQRPNRGEENDPASREEVPRGGHRASVDEDPERPQGASHTLKRKSRGARHKRRPERIGSLWIWRGAALAGLVALALGGFGIWSLLRDDDSSEQEQRQRQATEDLERRSEAVARSPEDVADCPDQGVYDASAPDVVAVLVNQDGCLVTQYVSLDGRTVESARIELFDADPNVLSVDVPLLASLDDHSGRQSQPSQWHHHELRADEWADIGEASPVTVAVIDTGVDSSHSVFDNRVSTVRVSGADRTHGTMVAGIIAELTGPSIVIKSWDVTSQCVDGSSGCLDFLPALVELTDSKIHSDVKVINLSLGCPDQQSCLAQFNNENARYTLRRLYEQGKIVVASAGNDYDQSEDDWPRWPVGWPEVVGVAAHRSDGELTAYTNRGDYVDLSAPSGDCSEYNFDSDTGKGSCGPIRDGLTVPSPGNGFEATAGGTSAAAPMVSAVIAQLWSAFPDVSNGQILDAIYQTASFQPGLRHGHGQVKPVAALELLFELARAGDTTTTIPTTSTAPPSTTAGIVQTAPDPPSLSLSRSDDVVTATWDSPDDGGAPIEGFRLVWLGYKNPSEMSEWSEGSSARSFEFPVFPCGIDVAIGIQARNSVGLSEQESQSTQTQSCSVPEAPSLLLSLSGDVVTATWDSPDDGGAPIERFHLVWLDSENPNDKSEWSEGSSAQSFKFPVFPCGIDVAIGIQARNSVGLSEQASQSTQTQSCSVPEAPSLLLSLSGDVVTATWDSPDDGGAPIERFHLVWLDSENPNDKSEWSEGSSAQSFKFPVFPCGIDVAIGIQARNSVGLSEQASQSTQTQSCSVPEAPSLLLSLSGDVVTATWDSPDDGGAPIERFHLVWLDSENPNDKSEWSEGSSAQSFKFPVFPCGIDVAIGIQARNSVGLSEQASKSIQTQSCSVPDPPSLSLSLSRDVVTASYVVTASWDSPDDGGAPIEGFNVFWLNSQKTYNRSEWSLRSSQRSFRFLDVPCGINAQIGITARNIVGSSGRMDRSIRTHGCPEVRIRQGNTAPEYNTDGSRCGNCDWIEMELRNFLPGQYNWACVYSGSENYPNETRVWISTDYQWDAPVDDTTRPGSLISVTRSNPEPEEHRCAAAREYITGYVYVIIDYDYDHKGSGDASTIGKYTNGVKSNEIDW